ncbi:DegT/DnrJ/EryC1/StrS family aminotransferase, partial [Candidatus Peregrinibacteria bacterium]|nr:DegT/DnrJ/EryC1/StrS family aminotransferase [Candidatus Peregrinibacteria bacterium]
IIPVHLFGLPVDMDGILQIAKKYKLYIIEDAACALGAEYNKRRCGGFGDIGCFSFHPRKVITTGEGGMVVTNTKKIAERISALRNHGKQNISFNLAGLNYRMTDFQGAIGWVQMERIEYLIKERIRLAGYYDKILRSIDGILIPAVKGDKRHVYQSYVILLDRKLNRDKIIKQLKGKGIEATIGTYALHTLPYYSKKYNYRLEDFPNSYKAFKNSIALPLHPKMKQNDAAKITDILIKLIKRLI